MPNHLVLALETLAALAAQAFLHGTVMRAALAVHVLVRAEQVLRLEGHGGAAGVIALEAARQHDGARRHAAAAAAGQWREDGPGGRVGVLRRVDGGCV